jgi:hypothetical protein
MKTAFRSNEAIFGRDDALNFLLQIEDKGLS